MNFLDNRYTRLALLTLGLGLLLWAIFWFVLSALGIRGFPVTLQLIAAFLGAGLVVYRYLSQRVF
jgi:hypothetical protein